MGLRGLELQVCVCEADELSRSKQTHSQLAAVGKACEEEEEEDVKGHDDEHLHTHTHAGERVV